MNIDVFNNLPDKYKHDIEQAKDILLKAGCTEIYIFGSIAHGNPHEDSDIDFAVRGCPRDNFFKLLGTLLISLNHSVDLIDLDSASRFNTYLEEHGELVRVA